MAVPFAQGVKQIQFEEADASSEWQFPYRLLMAGMVAWNPAIDLVVLGMRPDYAAWDDYGYRSRSAYIPVPDFWDAPFFQTNSDAGDGVITLTDPNLIDIVVPWNIMRTLGPGGCGVAVQYRTKDTDRRVTLALGRLPIIRGL